MDNNTSLPRLPPISKGNKRKQLGQPEVVHNNKREKLLMTNRFQPLAAQMEDEIEAINQSDHMEEEEEEEQGNVSAEISKSKIQKPPPIVLHGKPSLYKEFIAFLKLTLKNQFQLKYSKENTTIYVSELSDWHNLKQRLKNENAEFHSYTQKEEKTHAFVLTGLDEEVKPEEIEGELKEKGIEIKKVYKMRSKRILFLVITKSDVKLKPLQERIKVVNYTRVSWDRYYNKKLITQCHRCQMWNHATTNCNAKPACLKCAGEHWTHECTKSKDEPAVCVNCKGSHPANSTECTVYVQKIEKITSQPKAHKRIGKVINLSPDQFPELKQRYLPAPPPVRNAWNSRMEQAAMTTQANQQVNQPILASSQETTSSAPGITRSQQVSHLKIDQQINELSAEFKKLNSFVNLNNLLKAIRTLNTLLEGCQTSISKFETVNNFFLNIDSYGF